MPGGIPGIPPGGIPGCMPMVGIPATGGPCTLGMPRMPGDGTLGWGIFGGDMMGAIPGGPKGVP